MRTTGCHGWVEAHPEYTGSEDGVGLRQAGWIGQRDYGDR